MLTTFKQMNVAVHTVGGGGESDVLRGEKKKRSGKGEREREEGKESCFSNVKELQLIL